MNSDTSAVDKPLAYHDDTGRIILRASGLSAPICQHVAALRGLPASPPPQILQRAFDSGHQAEPLILEMLERRTGYKPLGHAQQRVQLDLGIAVIRGHIDELVRGKDHVVRACDVKYLGPDYFAQAARDGIASLLHYGMQFSVYMHGTNAPFLAVAVLKTLDEWGQPIITPDTPILVNEIDVAPHGRGEIVRHVGKIIAAYKGGAQPACPKPEGEWGCPYWQTLHAEKEEKPTVDLDPGDMERLRVALAQYDNAKKRAAEAKKAEESSKAAILEILPLGETVCDGRKVAVAKHKNPVQFDWKKAEADGLDVSAYRVQGEHTRVTVGKVK